LLAYYGFIANQTQNGLTLHGIVLLISVIPAVAGIIGGAFIIFYPLNNKMMIKIENDLTIRRQEL
jgi:GPH family glycoside/pentoside/hexuronide:cation symporter